MRRHQVALFVALPYPSGGLHEGNIVGSFLPADVYKRYLSKRKITSLVCSGLDAHGTGIWLQMRERNMSPPEFLYEKKKQYLAKLQQYSITPDKFDTTHRPDHGRHVRDHMARISSRVISVTKEGHYCPTCRHECSDRLLWDMKKDQCVEKLIEAGLPPSGEYTCRVCATPPQPRPLRYRALKYDPLLSHQAKKEFPALDCQESEKVLTRHLPWGVATGDGRTVYYVWVEALLAYSRMSQAPHRRFFFGKDNLYHHAVLLRQLSCGTPYATPATTFCRNHLLSGDRKISSSEKSPALVPQRADRLSLILADPVTQDTSYTETTRITAGKILENNLRNTFRRIAGLLKTRPLVPHVVAEPWTAPIVERYHRAMKGNEMKKALDQVLRYRSGVVQIIQAHVRDRTLTRTTLLHHQKVLLQLIDPLDPLLRKELAR